MSSEDESDEAIRRIQREIKVTSFSDLSKRAFQQLAARSSEMSEEVQKRIIEQIPNFTKLASESVNTMKDAFESTLASNDKSMDRVHVGYDEWRAALIAELSNPELTFDQRIQVFSLIGEAVERQRLAHKGNAAWLREHWHDVAMGSVAVVGVVVSAFAISRRRDGSNDA